MVGCCGGKAPVEYDESAYLKSVAGVKFMEKMVEINGKNRNFLSWLPETVAPTEVKGVVLFAHGLHEHALRFCNVAQQFVSRGFAFYAIDHVAHGKSANDGDRGLVEDYTIMVKDFVKFSEVARGAHPANKPAFIVCHSMGSLVVLLSLKSIPDVAAVVISGCALFSGPGASSLFGVKCLYPLSQLSVAVSIAKVLASPPASPRAE
jgi:alpha-beta hydrolase superfamily lysophospholipase